MAGLLEYLQTPGGIGLLSGVASYAANARRGQPVNSIGRGLIGGLTGYAQANDQIKQDEENAFQKRYRQMQMDEMQRKMEQAKAQQTWKAGLPQMMDKAQTKVTPFQPDDPFNQGPAAFGEVYGGDQHGQQTDALMANVRQGNPQALQDYLMRPESPYADKLMERQFLGEDAKPQLVTVYENGQPVQKWLRPGEADGVNIGQGKPEAERYKERTISPDGQTYVKQYSQDGGQTWQQIEGTKPYDIRAASGASNVTVNGFPKEVFKNERDLRNDFQGLPTTKAYREVQNSYDQIRFALANPSPANDLTAATKYMKLLDPGSVVRESELGMAMSATGLHDRITNYYDMLKSGKKLTPAQRQDFANAAAGLYAAATERYNQSAAEYRGMAKDYQLNPDRIAKPAQIEKPNKPQAGGLTASEKQELEQLRKRFKK